jgi:hypothetical protein
MAKGVVLSASSIAKSLGFIASCCGGSLLVALGIFVIVAFGGMLLG